ncbi:MAG TPA: acyl-CoA dehydrogenase family protein [Stellaceae bacterium]|nr:acyl-CoA dehydrogenase family protein [Stellaceae bacterium]
MKSPSNQRTARPNTPLSASERPSPSELYRRAEAFVPVLASRAEACEKLRHCPPETIDELAAAGLLQICRPARYGGYEYAWDVLSEVNRILARGCGSQAWVANVLNDHTQLVGAFPLEAQEEVWGKDPATRIAASVAPSGRARRVPGGAKLSGKFGFASGIDYAQWLICGAFLEEEGKPPAWWDFLVPKNAVTVVDDWYVAGLAGTGSKSFVVEDVLIPPHRFQDHIHSDDGTGPGTKINTASVFRTPRASVAALGFTALAVGIAEGFLQTYFVHTRARNSRGLAVAEFGSTQTGLAKATAQIEGAAAHMTAVLRRWIDLMEAGDQLDAHEKLKARFEAAFIARQCLDAVEALFAAAGGHAIFNANPLQRQLRDLIAVCTHRGLYLDESSVNYGKSALAGGRL